MCLSNLRVMRFSSSGLIAVWSSQVELNFSRCTSLFFSTSTGGEASDMMSEFE